MSQPVYGSSAPSYARVKFWVGEFKRGRTSLEDEARSGRPLDATDEEKCKKECVIHRVHMRRRIKSWFNTQTENEKEKEDSKSQYHSQMKQRVDDSKETELRSTNYSELFAYKERHHGVRTGGKSNSAEWYIKPGERDEKEEGSLKPETFDSKCSEAEVAIRQQSEKPTDVREVSDETAKARQRKSLSPTAKPKTTKKSKMKINLFKYVEGKKDKKHQQRQINLEKFKKMALEEKRQLYRCGENFLICDQIPSWAEVCRQDTGNSQVDESGQMFQPDAILNEKVALWFGDITRLEIDVVVNSTSSILLDRMIGENRGIREAAGIELDLDLEAQWQIITGSVFKTIGYRLPAKWIYHVSGPDATWTNWEFYLSECYRNALHLLKTKKLRTLAFPCISAGSKGIPAMRSAEVAMKTTRKWLEENHEYLLIVKLHKALSYLGNVVEVCIVHTEERHSSVLQAANSAEQTFKVDKVIFCVFEKSVWQEYNKKMPMIFPASKTVLEASESLQLKVEGNFFPASRLPLEILRMDNRSIELYKKALEDGNEKDYNIRLMVVGPYGVGKTTLTKRLLGQDVDITERHSTDGIDVHVRQCKISLKTSQWIVEPTGMRDSTSQRMIKVLESASKTATVESSGLDTTGSLENRVAEELKTQDDVSERKVVELPDTSADKGEDQTSDEMFNENFDTVDGILSSVGNIVEPPGNAQVKEEDILMEHLKEIIADVKGGVSDDDHASVSVWDFGGQFVFYTTHQMFLSHRAIYILVNKMSQHIGDIVMDDEPYFDCGGMQSLKLEDFLDIWLNSIHGHSKLNSSGIPPIVLVGTHADRLNPENKEKEIEAIFDAIRNRFAGKDVSLHFIDKDFGLDNAANDPKLEELRETITELAKQQSYWGELKPAKWIPFEKLLEDLRSKNVQIISRQKVEELNQTLPVPITHDEELELFLRFQHETANIMYFSVPELRDKIVLSPQFLVNALKSLITAEMFCKKRPAIIDKWQEFRQKGILKTSLLDAVWDRDENRQFQENRGHILALMEHLNIIAKPVLYTEEEESHEDIATQESYLVPCMLKESPPKAVFHNETAFISTPCLCLALGNVAFPSAIFNRLLVGCTSCWPLARSEKQYHIYCGCGQFDVDIQHRLTLSFSSNVISLTVTRYSQINRHPDVSICHTVYSTVKQILERIGRCLSIEIKFDEFVQCPLGQTVSGPCRHSVKKLKECDDFPCHEHNSVAIIHSSDLLKYWFEVEGTDHNTSSEDRSKLSVLTSAIATQIPTEQEIAKISQGIGKEFQQLALQLGITQARIDQIRGSDPLNVADQITQLLLEWRKRRGRLATFGELEKAMKAVGIDTLTVLKDFLE